MSLLVHPINPKIWQRPFACLLRRDRGIRWISKLSTTSTLPFPVTEICPEPTCSCAATPSGLDIDRERPLNGTMAAYAQQVLVCTGRDNWTSRIEEDEEAGGLVRGLKALLGRGGKFSDPYNNIMLTNSSLPQSRDADYRASYSAEKTVSPSQHTDSRASISPEKTASAYLLPSFTYLPSIPLNPESLEILTQAFFLPQTLHPAHSILPPDKRSPLRSPSLQKTIPHIHPTTEILILICGHLSRDQRCGILGPLLRAEFTRVISANSSHDILTDPPSLIHDDADAPPKATPNTPTPKQPVRIALISHIGGHAFAGNVIIYLPPSMAGTNHPLAGKGIWYGRVEPRHVEGIVAETVGAGRVIRELFRGGIAEGGEVLRI